MKLAFDGSDIMHNKYSYDAVDNILGIANTVNPQELSNNSAKLGGESSHSYQYDALNRLISASGSAKDASYTLDMAYNVMSMPVSKAQSVENSSKAASYTNVYKYEDDDHPSAPSQIGHEHYTYDANGNPVRVENDSTDATREMYWDEDNRLMVLSDNGKTSRYTYNHAGERIVKSHGSMEGVYINGAPQGITFHETDEYTLYPASILSVTKNRFTKHYFIGSKRVASRIGSGSFNNMYGVNGSHVTAGQQDYAERLNQIESQKEDYYKKLGIAPGIPTMKGSYADPENTGIGYNTIIKELGDHSVPAEWAQYVKHNTEADTAPGAPIAWDDPSDPDEAQPGYGFVADSSSSEEETYFFHSDHLGSTSYITDKDGNITQYDAYLPYGELLVDEHSSSEEMPYKFNGKEFDEETGLYYYGARYMNPVASVWYGVDAMMEKYPNVSGYTYCLGNPVKLVDIYGMYPVGIVKKHEVIKTRVVEDLTAGHRNPRRMVTQFYKEVYYTFTESAAHLLSLVSGVDEEYIKNARLEEFRFQVENNCMTVGSSPEKTHILVSPEYFDDSHSSSERNYYNWWLVEFSHEVGHIKQIDRDRNIGSYLLKTIWGYISNKGHDAAPREIEAERGSKKYEDFRDFVIRKFNSDLPKLLMGKDSEERKIEQLDKWWNAYIESEK